MWANFMKKGPFHEIVVIVYVFLNNSTTETQNKHKHGYNIIPPQPL